MRKGLLMCIWGNAQIVVSRIWLCNRSLLNFLIYSCTVWGKCAWFSFLLVWWSQLGRQKKPRASIRNIYMVPYSMAWILWPVCWCAMRRARSLASEPELTRKATERSPGRVAHSRSAYTTRLSCRNLHKFTMFQNTKVPMEAMEGMEGWTVKRGRENEWKE